MLLDQVTEALRKHQREEKLEAVVGVWVLVLHKDDQVPQQEWRRQLQYRDYTVPKSRVADF